MGGGRLILVCGLPGAGKTTLASTLGGIRLCPDEWMIALGIDLWDQPARGRIEALQWSVAEDVLASGADVLVVVEWGLWTRAEREVLRVRARSLGASVELRYLDVPVDVLWSRVERRQLEGRFGARPIERSELEAWAASFEPPDEDELRLYDPPAAG